MAKQAVFGTGLLFLGISGAVSLLMGGFLGCTKTPSFVKEEWSPYETSTTKDLPSIVDKASEFELKTTRQIYLKNGTTVWKQQTVYDIPIMGTWMKENTDKSGEKKFFSYRMLDYKSPPIVPPSFFKDSEDYKEALKKIGEVRPRFKKWVQLYPAFLPKGHQLQAVWVLTGLTENGEFHERILQAGDYSTVEEKRVGSDFQMQIPHLKALAYPDGPKRSELQEVELVNLYPGKFLSSSKLKVYSASGQNVPVADHPLLIPTEDERFSQVQVFFTLQKANEWFEKVLGWTWAGVLNVETDLGYPEQLNSAFYYQNRIRFGDGDGKTYENIPLDPSIVIHESAHSVIDRMTDLPFQGEGGSLNEAFADLLAACALDRAYMGEVAYKPAAYTRNLSEPQKWGDLNGGLYNDSLVVSHLLWRLRNEMGEKKTLQLVVALLRDLTPDETLDTFRQKLLFQAGQFFNHEQQTQFYSDLEELEWPR